MTWTTKKDLNDTLDEIMEITTGKKGLRITCDYAEDARYIYPERITTISELVGKLRSQVDLLPEDK